MQTEKVLKDLVKKKMLTKEMIINAVINYENRIKDVKVKIKEYEKLKETDFDYIKYCEIYKTEFRDLIYKKKQLLYNLKPKCIVMSNSKYYLKFKETLKDLDVTLFCRLYKEELFLFGYLKRFRGRVYSKSYTYDKYTMNFCNKIFDLISVGDYKII